MLHRLLILQLMDQLPLSNSAFKKRLFSALLRNFDGTGLFSLSQTRSLSLSSRLIGRSLQEVFGTTDFACPQETPARQGIGYNAWL
jgi:hypothetical protein